MAYKVLNKIAGGSRNIGENWTVTLSHEALELVADPGVNLLVAEPHPEDPKRDVSTGTLTFSFSYHRRKKKS